MFSALAGCSLQASRPAPVENLASSKPIYDKGSIKAKTYKVKKGDTLYSISWGAGRDFSEIAKINQLDKPYTIFPGQILVLNSSTNVTNKKKSSDSSGNTQTSSSQVSKVSEKQIVNNSLVGGDKQQSSTKKLLDHQAKPAYSVTSPQQNINQTILKPVSTLPEEVSRWMWPVKGKLIGTFSATEQGNKGIKIAGKRGEVIKAAADGRVVYAGNALRGYGNLVIIKHNDDYLSAYAHADAILVKEKQQVTAGQTVAKMGNTGTNQVMLHFEIRYHGQSVNPLIYLPKQ